MDGLPFSSVSILVHDSNDRSLLSVDDSTCCDYGNLIDPVIVNPLDVYILALILTLSPAIPPMAPISMRTPLDCMA